MQWLRFLLAAGLFACGAGGTPTPPAPDAGPDPIPPDFEPGCEVVLQDAVEPFRTAEDFGPVTPGTLAGWNPDGRWFFTGQRVGGVSGVHLERRGDQVIVDRDEALPGTIDDDAVFHRFSVLAGGPSFTIAKRLIDLRADGTLRVDRAVCDGKNCQVCTARVERAARNGGEGESDKLSLVGEYYGDDWEDVFTFNVRMAGTLAYLIREDGLRIIETADPANPVELGHWRRNGDGYSNDLKIVDTATKRYVLIADTPVDVVDVTDPTQPMLAATISEEAHTVFVETRDGTTLAYFGNYDATTPVYDVTDPTQPTRLGRFESDAPFIHDLSVEDGIAYLNGWDAGMYVVDFTTPSSPQLRATFVDTPTGTSHSNWTTTIGGRHLAIHGEEGYGAHLDVVDLDAGSPTFMKSIGSYKTRDWVSIHNILAFGTKAYVTHYQDGVRVLDLADPTQPVLAGYFNTWDPQGPLATSAFFDGAVGLDLDFERKLIFVADARGLVILRDDTP
jgi:hypothetical protein